MERKQGNEWITTGASVTGTGHIETDCPCQDAHDYLSLPNATIIGVADGLSSASHADRGAQLAVSITMSYLAAGLTKKGDQEGLLRRLAKHIRQRLHALAERENNSINEYATTLLAGIITPTSISTMLVGDGGIVIKHGDGFTTITNRPPGSYTNVVIPITSDEYKSATKIHSFPADAITGIALFSDGVESIAIQRPQEEAVPGLFDTLFTHHPSRIGITDWLTSERVNKRTDDDKTIVIATKQQGAKR